MINFTRKSKDGSPRAKLRGFTLVETLVGVVIFTIISIGIFQAFLGIFDLVRLARLKGLAAMVANQQLEIMRNLTYSEVGIVDGIPAGVVPREQVVTAAGVSFTVTTTVRNIDDPFDGTIGGNPNDLSPADQKLVEVLVACDTCKNFTPLTVTSTIAPENLETASGNGALFVRVLDASGAAVPQADVHIENNQAVPPIVIDETTNNDGLLQLVDVIPGNLVYETGVSKTGYSSAQTYTIDPNTNPNPLPPHSTVLAGQVTQISLAIDRVSQFDVLSQTKICAPIGSLPFTLKGAKLIGNSPTVYKYDQTFTTNTAGQKTVPNLEWDTYNFTQTSASYDLAGTIPLLPITLPPNTTQNVSLVLEPKIPKSVLVIVKDGITKLPLSGADVTLAKTGFSESLLTDRGFLRQTDWSGGAGQGELADPTKFFVADPLANANTTVVPGQVALRQVLTDYQTPGWLESSIFDTGGSQTTYYNLGWAPTDQSPDLGPDSVKFQIATANSTTSPFTYLGPDGTAESYYTLSDTNLNATHTNQRFLRYKLFLSTASSTLTPSVSDVSVTFGSECLPYGQVFFNGLQAGVYSLDVAKTGYQSYTNDVFQVAADWQAVEILLNP